MTPTSAAVPAWFPGASSLNRVFARYGRLVAPQSFGRHALTISSGVAISQAIALLAGPGISRLFTPLQMGTVAMLTSAVALLLPFASLRFELALMTARDKDEADGLLALLLGCAAMVSAFLLVAGCVVPAGRLLSWGLAPEIVALRWVIPLLLFGTALQSALRNYGTNRMAHRALATSLIAQTVGSTLLKLVGGLWWAATPVLLVAELLKPGFGLTLIPRNAGLRVRDLLRQVSLRHLGTLAWQHRRFPLFSVWSVWINILGLQAPIQLLSSR